AVFAQCLRNKSIVKWIIHGCIDDPIQLNQAALFVDFVFCTRTFWYFDDTIQVFRGIGSDGNLMPGVLYHSVAVWIDALHNKHRYTLTGLTQNKVAIFI